MELNSFAEYITLEHPLTIIDIGARGGVQKRWKEILCQVPSKLIGFEPDQEECVALNEWTPDNQLFIPAALSSEDGERIFYRTESVGNCSFYNPNAIFIRRFVPSPAYKVNETLTIMTTTLDNALSKQQIKDVDFIKMDVEGSEVDIIVGGGKRTLQSVFGIEVEVWFNEIYQGQPLFSDVDFALREKGFRLFDVARSNFFKRAEGKHLGGPKGQLMTGDALYFRDLLTMNNKSVFWTASKLVKCILILIAYGYYDYALEILEIARQRQAIDPPKLKILTEVVMRSGSRKLPYFRGRWRVSNWLKNVARWLSVREKDFLGNW